MYRLHPLSLALLASVGIAAIPRGGGWLFSALTLLASVLALGWGAIRPKHVAMATRTLYGAVLVIATISLALSLWNAVPDLVDLRAAMPVTVNLAPQQVAVGATVLNAQATIVREGAPLSWRTLWFAVEVLPYVAALAVLLLLLPLARRPDEPFERGNVGRLYAAGSVLVVTPIALGIGVWALERGAATALGIVVDWGSEGTGLLNVGALGVGLVLLALGYSVRAASELREFERSVI